MQDLGISGNVEPRDDADEEEEEDEDDDEIVEEVAGFRSAWNCPPYEH